MLRDQILNAAIKSPGLAIKTSGSAVVKTSNQFGYRIAGKLYSKDASDAPAFTAATIPTGYKAILALSVNAAGTLSWSKSANIANANPFDQNDLIAGGLLSNEKALIGFVRISAVSADFVLGTTALDAATASVEYYQNVDNAFIGA